MTELSPALPDELQTALNASPEASVLFATLPPSHKQEYVKWVAEAKRPETRMRRAEATIERLVAPTPPLK